MGSFCGFVPLWSGYCFVLRKAPESEGQSSALLGLFFSRHKILRNRYMETLLLGVQPYRRYNPQSLFGEAFTGRTTITKRPFSRLHSTMLYTENKRTSVTPARFSFDKDVLHTIQGTRLCMFFHGFVSKRIILLHVIVFWTTYIAPSKKFYPRLRLEFILQAVPPWYGDVRNVPFEYPPQNTGSVGELRPPRTCS